MTMTHTEDDTFEVLRGASFIEMYLLCTENLELGQDVAYANIDLLQKHGWTIDEFRMAYVDSKLPLTSSMKDPEWRKKLKESDTEHLRTYKRKV